jgi:hypothetical protein
MSEDSLTDAQYEQMLKDRETIKAALNGPRAEEVKQAFIDFVRFPPKSGKVK